MNFLDALIVALIVLFAIRGFQRGAALQLVTYVGLIVGLVAGALLAPVVASFAPDPVVQASLALGTLILLGGAGDAVGWVIGRKAWAAARRSRLDPVDSAAGSVVAIVAVLLATWFLAFNLVQGPVPALAREIRGSAVVRALDTLLPRPPSLLAQVRGLLNRFGFPEVFSELPPPPAGPVKGPTGRQVNEAFDAADQSTLKVLGRACDKIQNGSGFIVADGYVVTNAHVVAGVSEPQVQQQGGESFKAATVLFDPNLDVALLRVDGSPGEALGVHEKELGRGQRGAVLGYPGGGDLRGRAAAVRRSLEAVGRDIYGRRQVTREVYELQAIVRPGNSGGPFVDLDGRVAGLVFAASTTDNDIGYALTSRSVMRRVGPSLQETEPVDTGPCI